MSAILSNAFEPSVEIDTRISPSNVDFRRIREQIENNLLPHLPVEINRFGQWRTIHDQPQPRPLNCRAKDAGELCGEQGKIRWFKGGVHAADFDPHEIQQPIHQLKRRRALRCSISSDSAGRRNLVGQRIFNRPQDQRERCAQLVAHVAEKRRLRAIEIGQHLGRAYFRLVGFGVGDACGYLTGNQVKESGITWSS